MPHIHPVNPETREGRDGLPPWVQALVPEPTLLSGPGLATGFSLLPTLPPRPTPTPPTPGIGRCSFFCFLPLNPVLGTCLRAGPLDGQHSTELCLLLVIGGTLEQSNPRHKILLFCGSEIFSAFPESTR